MIDPIIFEFDIFNLHLALYWYGLIVGIGVMVGAYILTREILWRGGDDEPIWDMLTWIVIGGILGARLYYVLNDVLGGGQYFVQNPSRILAITEGGLHIYGAILGGLLGVWGYTRRKPYDWFLLLDSFAPALLIGQGVGRIANFINQELYGPPTDLPWGIPISAENRMEAWRDLTAFPVETTRFHPTFAYEMILNFIAAGLLYWLTRKFREKFKPGSAFYLWLIFAGVIRFIIEYWRPDQPTIGDTTISITRIVTVIMALVGSLLFANRQGWFKLPISPGPDHYILPKRKKHHRKEK